MLSCCGLKSCQSISFQNTPGHGIAGWSGGDILPLENPTKVLLKDKPLLWRSLTKVPNGKLIGLGICIFWLGPQGQRQVLILGQLLLLRAVKRDRGSLKVGLLGIRGSVSGHNLHGGQKERFHLANNKSVEC